MDGAEVAAWTRYVPYWVSGTNMRFLVAAARVLSKRQILCSPPDPYRRRVAMAFGELLNAEVEYVPLSRDTTESDLKQVRNTLRLR